MRDDDAETRAYAAAGISRSGEPRAARILTAAREAEATKDPALLVPLDEVVEQLRADLK